MCVGVWVRECVVRAARGPRTKGSHSMSGGAFAAGKKGTVAAGRGYILITLKGGTYPILRPPRFFAHLPHETLKNLASVAARWWQRFLCERGGKIRWSNYRGENALRPPFPESAATVFIFFGRPRVHISSYMSAHTSYLDCPSTAPQPFRLGVGACARPRPPCPGGHGGLWRPDHLRQRVGLIRSRPRSRGRGSLGGGRLDTARSTRRGAHHLCTCITSYARTQRYFGSSPWPFLYVALGMDVHE